MSAVSVGNLRRFLGGSVIVVALVALAVARVAAFDGTRGDALLMVFGVATFVAVQVALVLARADDVTRIVYGYLATFYFGNRALAEVWLGPVTEAGAGTVAPLLLGDFVLLAVVLRSRVSMPSWLFAVAAALLAPAVNLILDPQFDAGAFAYQYLAIVRAAAVAAVIVNLLRRDGTSPPMRIDAYLTHVGGIFAALGLLTGTIALVTGERFGLPGWGVNVYANALAVVGAVCGWRAIYHRRGRLLQLALLVGCLAGIVGSGTRLSLLVLTGVLLWSAAATLVSRRWRVFAHVSVGVVVGVVFVGLTGPLLMLLGDVNPRFATVGGLEITQSTGPVQVIEALQRESSVRTRLTLWEASLEMVAANPTVGVGWGQWNRLKGEYGVEFRVLLDPHNGYLWALAEGGILGMVVIYLVLLAVLASLRPSMPAFAVLLALVLELSNANLQKPLFAVLVGVLMALAWHASRRPAQQPAPGTPGGSAPEVPVDDRHHPTDVLLGHGGEDGQ